MTPESQGRRLGSFLGALVLGAAAGATFALLTAPRSGRETRERLTRGLFDLGETIEGFPDAIGRDGPRAVQAGQASFEQTRDAATRSTDKS